MIADFWAFHKESIILACVIAVPTGILFSAGCDLYSYIRSKCKGS